MSREKEWEAVSARSRDRQKVVNFGGGPERSQLEEKKVEAGRGPKIQQLKHVKGRAEFVGGGVGA